MDRRFRVSSWRAPCHWEPGEHPRVDIFGDQVRFPPELPITDRLDDLRRAITDHQVVVVAGETGSGKSTQLPKLCLQMGRGSDGWIGHTQPRRIAARSIAERVAEELETEVGRTVGYAVRFTDKVGANTSIKLMTDGILLAEIQRDRMLRRYDTIIIDEAHERSLNIDFLLGYLRQLLPRRPSLKVIITSATIDTQKFSDHFFGAPIITVSGRTYPVEVRYQPIDGTDGSEPVDQVQGICDAVEELWKSDAADTLVFCSGEREIREAVEALNDLKLGNTEVVPLYGRLSAAEQHRVFAPRQGRRIVVATNVAETSLTVPRIRSVIDTGTARISRYSNRTKVQRLPIEAISQASADQRAGRCGRLGPGTCIRLYAEDDYDARPEFTEPEIQRTNLASVILQMASLGLGSAEDFPFVDPPERRNIRDGIALLQELDAVDPDQEGTKKWVTGVGRDLARLPVDPRMGRMLIEGAHEGRLAEVLVIVAGLSIQDPRERPMEKSEAAAQLHARFDHPTSDFVSYLSLWEYARRKRKELSSGAFRRLCIREFIHHNRTKEWMDLERQLHRACKELDLNMNQTASVDTMTQPMLDGIHRSLLAGLLSHVGTKINRDKKSGYRGARNTEFVIARGSALQKNSPNWVMAGELVETNRLYARVVARIDPVWLEDLASHLVKRSFDDPWWDFERGSAVTNERVSLYGLPIVGGRRIQLGRVSPALARELFVENALVDQNWPNPPEFLRENANVISEVEASGARARSDVVADRRILVEFYDQRVPEDVVSVSHFNRWWKQHRKRDANLFSLQASDLLDGDHPPHSAEEFPDHWDVPALGISLALSYEFDHTSPLDGITVEVPVAVLPQLQAEWFHWQVPGYRVELIDALLRGLPKAVRKPLLPMPETVKAILPELNPDAGPMFEQIQRALRSKTGIQVALQDLAEATVPRHLRPAFNVVDASGATLAGGKDLASLRRRLEQTAQDRLREGGHPLETSGLTDWTIGDLPNQVETVVDSMTVSAFPTLHDDADSASVRLVATAPEQALQHWNGARRLLRLNAGAPARQLDHLLDNKTKLAIASSSVQSRAQWYSDAVDCALDSILERAGGPPWTQTRFQALTKFTRSELQSSLELVASLLAEVLDAEAEVSNRLDDPFPANLQDIHTDAEEHRRRILYPGVLTGFGLSRIPDLVRYLTGISSRLDAAATHPDRDRRNMGTCRRLEARYQQLVSKRDSLGSGVSLPSLEDIGWALEEFRVSSFAQQLGTNGKVSETRISKALLALS